MTAQVDESGGEAVLAFVPKNREVWPLSTFAFTFTQSKKRRLQDWVGTLLLYRSGRIERIVSVERGTLTGATWRQKLASALFGVWRVEVRREEVEMSFSELAGMIAEHIHLDMDEDAGEPHFAMPDTEESRRSIRATVAADQLFALINMPHPDGCLDQL